MIILNNYDDANLSTHVLSDRKVLVQMKSIHCQGPNYGFICLSVSKIHPWKTHLGETSINLEKQIDKDNSRLSGSELRNGKWEVCAFMFGFSNHRARKCLHERVNEALRWSRRNDKPLAPCCLRNKFKSEVGKFQLKLKFVKCCVFSKDVIRLACQSNHVDLIET